jgi:hypothetical protein
MLRKLLVANYIHVIIPASHTLRLCYTHSCYTLYIQVSVMNFILNDWLKKRVHIVMRTPNVAALDGALVQVDSVGLIIELLKGQSTHQKFVPWSSILHIDLQS